MSTNALVTIAPAAIQSAEVNFKSRFLDVKPATLSINQPNTQVDGAIKGHLRISETSQQFAEMNVTLLVEPEESRSYYIGERGTMNRIPENLMCFSRDLKEPDKKSKVPQSIKCATCPKADWKPWRDKKDATGIKDSKLIPPCEISLRVMLVDTVFKIPLQMYVRSNARKKFEDGLESVARIFELIKAQGKVPNWYDVSFKLTTEAFKNPNGTVTYVPKITDAKQITPDERIAFGEIYTSFTRRLRRNAEEQALQAAEAQLEKESSTIDAELLEPGTPGAVEVPAQEITI